MAISQTKAITRLYSEVTRNGIEVPENESIESITKLCESKGQFLVHVDSYWSFVKTVCDNKPCVRMIFSIKENSGGKVHNIDRVVDIIRSIETVFIFVDKIKVVRTDGFIQLDVIKIQREN